MSEPSLKIAPGSVEWEELCQRCGRCCFEKIEYRERIFYTDRPCPYLNRDTKLCRVYPQRNRLQPDCAQLTPELAAAGVLPDDCPYVLNARSD